MFSKVPVLVCHFGKDEYVKNALRVSSKNNKIIFIVIAKKILKVSTMSIL